tara:strand:+ start:8582 stop:9394 length:813 start_codon:yes stop_codon:yes gene_type:complete
MLSTDRRFERVAISKIRDIPPSAHDPILTRSIEALGQEVPVILGYNGLLADKPFRIIEGVRRTLSMIHLGECEVLAEVREDPRTSVPEQVARDAKSTLATNVNRSRNLGAEVEAIRQIAERRGDNPLISNEELLDVIVEGTGMHRREAKVLIGLHLGLTEPAKVALIEGHMTASVAKRFSKLPSEDQDRLAREPRITGKDVESALRAISNSQLSILEDIDIPALPTPEPSNLSDLVDSYAQRLSGDDRSTLVAAAIIIRRHEQGGTANVA